MTGTDDAIFNARNGERMRFERDATGALLRIETPNPPCPAEPEYTHPQQESSVEVLSGVLHFSVRGAVRAVGGGEKIVIPAGAPHTFWNEGKEEERAIQEFRPALRTEDFFRTYFSLARDGNLDAQGMPSLLQLAVLVPAFSDEIRPTRPPWPVLRLLAAILGPLARWRGYRAVYP